MLSVAGDNAALVLGVHGRFACRHHPRPDPYAVSTKRQGRGGSASICNAAGGQYKRRSYGINDTRHKRRIVAGNGGQTVLSSIFGPEMPQFNPMRVIRNRVVDEWNDRLKEVPTRRDQLPEIGRTRFLDQDRVLRKFDAFLATTDTEADWEEMPWLGGQGIGLIHDIPSAADAVDTMMTEAGAILGRLAGSIRP